MYYNRKICDSFAKLIEPDGELRWLYNFVLHHPELDLLIGKNKAKLWISVYRGLSRVLTILKTRDSDIVKIDGAKAFKEKSPNLYGKKELPFNFANDLKRLVVGVSKDPKFDRYYINKKEGFYQNELSRMFGICGKPNDDFVIIDKEAVVGYENQLEKDNLYGKIREKYKNLQKQISSLNAKRYGKNLEKKTIGNELDFLALDRQGNILLIEYKHGTNTSGIYLSPLQIGMYLELFSQLPLDEFKATIIDMIEQKKKIGLINSKWKTPEIKKIIPVLIISDSNCRSTAKKKFHEVLDFVRSKKGNQFLHDIKTFNYSSENGMTPL
jgi:hypothetical protein